MIFLSKSNFCRVGQNIWCQAHLLEGVDVETFTVIKPTIGRDKNYYYYEEHRYTHQEYAEKDVERYYTFG
ncbi:DKNYY domain-containing protein [Providencia vermicola]